MIKALQTLPVKGCIALLIAAYAVCAVGGAAADQPEWVRSGWKMAQNRGRSGVAGEGAAGDPDPNEIQSLRQRAEAGEASAQSALGWKHYRGDGVPQKLYGSDKSAPKRRHAGRRSRAMRSWLDALSRRWRSAKLYGGDKSAPKRRHAGRHCRTIYYRHAACPRTWRPAKLPGSVCLAFHCNGKRVWRHRADKGFEP